MERMEGIGKFGHAVRDAFVWFLRFFWLALAGLAIWAVWVEQHRPPLSEAEKAHETLIAKMHEQQNQETREREQRKLEEEKYLCRKAAACKKYDQVRLDCATAGNFKTCLRIKMGEDVSYADVCSGYDVGAPAIPLDPKTPDVVRCYILNNF
jgi:hypothetical protein